MDAKAVREWINSIARTGLYISKYYKDPYQHWVLLASEQPKQALIRLVEVIFLSTAIQLLFLSATYKNIAASFGLNVARVVLLQIVVCLFYFPGMLLAFKTIRPITRPRIWHIADYVVMQTQVTVLFPTLLFAIFYSSESYVFYILGTIFTLLAGAFFYVRTALVPSNKATWIRRFASSFLLLIISVAIVMGVILAVYIATPSPERSFGSVFEDPVASEVFSTELKIDTEMKELSTVDLVAKSISAFNEVIGKLVLQTTQGDVQQETIDFLSTVNVKLDATIKADREILDRITPELRIIKESSKFRITGHIIDQSQDAVASYDRFLGSTEVYFETNRDMIGTLVAIAPSKAVPAIVEKTPGIRRKGMTAKEVSRKLQELDAEIARLTYQVKRLNGFITDGIVLTKKGISTVADMRKVLNSVLEFQSLVTTVRKISPLYSVSF